MQYINGYNKKLHISKEEFENAVAIANSVANLCEILSKSKPSVYTYASRFGIPLKGIFANPDPIRKDGYYCYGSPKNHRRIIETSLGRKLSKNEGVHHIDGNKLNNDLSNLVVLNWDIHQKAHGSLEKCAFELVKKGFIEFDSETKTYKLKDNEQLNPAD